MADPKKKAPAAGSAGEQGPKVNKLPEPTWTADAYDQALSQPEQAGAQGEQAAPVQEHPVTSWWDRMTNTAKELPRSIARGVVGAVNETAQTVAEGGASIARHTGLGELETPGYNAAYDAGGAKALVGDMGAVKQDTVDHYLGKRSDDPIASFAESATQFATGFAATGELELAAGGVKLGAMGAKAALARGAITDLTVFDPYESQLAELAARTPIPGLKQIGSLLSVNEDTDPIVARVKRAAAGVLTGAAMDGILARAKIVREARKLKAGVTGAEKEAAEATIHAESKVVQDVADGTHVSPEDPFVVERSGDEQWSLRVNPENHEAKALGLDIAGEGEHQLHFPDRAEAEAQAATAGMSTKARFGAKHAMDTQDVDKVVARFSEMVKNEDHAGIVQLMDETGHFNVSYMTEPTEHLAAIQTLSEKMGTVIDAAQARGQKVEDMISSARKVMGALTPETAPKFFQKKLGQQQGQAVYNYAADMYMKHLGGEVAKLAVLREARPHDPVVLKDASEAIGTLLETQRLVAGANSEWGRTGRLMQERGNGLADGWKFKTQGAEQAATEGAQQGAPHVAEVAADNLKQKVAGMDQRTIDDFLRAVRISGGEPKNLYAVAHAAKTVIHEGAGDKFMEIFANSLLSRPVTSLTQIVSGATVSAFEPVARMVAGAAGGNKALVQEGADMLSTHFKYLGDNITSMWASLQAGKSILNPQAQHTAWSGKFGEFVRTPSRVIIGMDEFTKAANYRAYVRAKSLRLGREAGLTGQALEQYAERDLSAAFDKGTGIAMVPDAIKFGEQAGMSSPLEGEFGRKYQQLMETSLLARVITPFVKAPINMFNYAWSITPGLNRFNSEAAKIMAKGGEEAATLHAKSLIAGSLYTYGALHAAQGNLTGRGPTDPKLRKLWLEDNQPYSIKVGGEWVSYKRADPIGMPLGLIADAVTFGKELSKEHAPGVEDYAVAVSAALTSALSSRSYLQGLTQFAQAWGQGDVHSARSWIHNFGANLAVPGVVDSFNPDQTMREVETMGDAIMARVPGYSEKLDPKFNLFGEPVMRAGVAQRAFNPFMLRDVSHSVNESLQAIGTGFPTPPRQEMGGQIDLGDKRYDTKGVGKSPYARWMELVSQTSLKQDVQDLVKTPEWKGMSNGTDDFKGGEQALRVSGLIERHYAAARRQMESEYPLLAQHIREVRRMKGAAIRGGASGVADVQAMFGKQ